MAMDERQMEELIKDGTRVARLYAAGRYSVTIGGSRGKGVSDERSDVDFRVYFDARVQGEEETNARSQTLALMERWRARGVEIDGIWARTTGFVDEQLDLWLCGKGAPISMQWTVFGYYILTDIANQLIVDDPFGIAATWKQRLSVYPDALYEAVVRQHMGRLRYWRGDYHYQSKIARGDEVFLATLSMSLVRDIMQVLFALNRTYFPGDGANLRLAETFAILPRGFAERISLCLYPGRGPQALAQQAREIASLVDELETLLPA